MRQPFAALAALMLLTAAAHADDKIGIVLMHGKQGIPLIQ